MSNTIDKYKERCRDCVCLTESDEGGQNNGLFWYCDEVHKRIDEVENCPEGLELNEEE